MIGGLTDHICPWQATYRSARLLGSKDNRYVLSTSGHIAGAGQPARQPQGVLPHRFCRRGRHASSGWTRRDKSSDSWWPDYTRWLAERSGPEIDAPRMLGGEELPPLGPGAG